MSVLADTTWDVIVIGTGIGGGTIGRSLAEAGLKVLFVEKGPAGPRKARNGLDAGIFDPVARAARGAWPTPLRARVNGRSSEFFAPLGAGVGGSSVFYAATLERPERHDLDPAPGRDHPTGGWPVSFDNMLGWYDKAAKQYALSGGTDPLSSEPPLPLRDPPQMSDGDAAMMRSLSGAGLHPYRLNSALRNVEGCLSCLGVKCPMTCKMDGRSAGVEPALATGNAALLDRCEVRVLHGADGAVSHVEALHDGAPVTLRARHYVLAGGALGSAHLLLRSASEAWPEGAANSSGMVGRNLMFHLNEMLALWPARDARFAGPSKAISLRDFYHMDGQRFGTVQAMGIDAGYGEIAHYLNLMFERSALRGIKPLRQLTRLPAAMAAKLFGNAKVFVGLMEDLPYADNRVVIDPDATDALSIEYTFHEELLTRRRAFRKAIRKGLKGQRKMFLGMQPELNFGHPCGTARFGTDPATSVLDANCRSHDLRNLSVVDASFMPTSLGVNPSLTIAANALRVGHHLSKGSQS